MPTRKLWNHTIDIKEGFIPRKGKVYLLLREEREEVYKFISEQLRKEYIRLSKLPQIVSVFFVGKKGGKSIWYRTIGVLINGLLRIITLYLLFQTL